jgi:eukaryotic-like serine/threonine-protein kinase
VTAPRLRIEARGPGELLLSGVIDEHARLLEVVERGQPSDGGGGEGTSGAIGRTASGSGAHASASRRLVLDLGEITFINSLGVRDWIRFLARAAREHVRLELVRVSEPMVQQFNMIVATRSGAEVRSFFAPFACDACGLEDSICIEVAPNLAALRALSPPPVACRRCQAPMAFNDFPERYFSFLGDG